MKWVDGKLVSPIKKTLYGEQLFQGNRTWDPRRSKLAALIARDPLLDFTPEMRVLYLGAGHGATVFHLAGYVEVVYAIEIAARPFQDLLRISREVPNCIPLMADATDPASYAPFVEQVDLLYQDVAHPAQTEIALRNRMFLRPGGLLVLMLKTACVDSTRPPEEIFSQAMEALSAGYRILRTYWLSPHFPDHAAILAEAVK